MGLRQYVDCGLINSDMSVDFVVIDIVRVRLRLLTGNPMAFADPLAQVYEAAAFTAEGAVFGLRRPLNAFAAGGAGYGFDFAHNRQQLNVKWTSSEACVGRSFSAASMKRMVKRCLPPLISGK